MGTNLGSYQNLERNGCVIKMELGLFLWIFAFCGVVVLIAGILWYVIRNADSIRRMQELHRLHRVERAQLRSQQVTSHILSPPPPFSGLAWSTDHHNPLALPIPFATFSQIPGIPNTLSSSERVLTPQELLLQSQTHNAAVSASSPLAQAYQQMNSLGFLLIPSAFNIQHPHIPQPPATMELRASLTSEQRKAHLEQLLVCRQYRAEEAAAVTDIEEGRPPFRGQELAPEESSTSVTHGDVKVVDGDPACSDTRSSEVSTANAATSLDNQVKNSDKPSPPSYSLALQLSERACAICLDDFAEGELINDTPSICPHVFHKDCLLQWLDRHDVCPCCRKVMISEDEWKAAVGTPGAAARVSAPPVSQEDDETSVATVAPITNAPPPTTRDSPTDAE